MRIEADIPETPAVETETVPETEKEYYGAGALISPPRYNTTGLSEKDSPVVAFVVK